MIDVDRIFLKDLQNFSFKNHMMAVEALVQGGGDAKRYAALYLKHENPKLDDAAALALEQKTNEGARFQRVMFAKLFAEYVAAVEDFGALGFAIRHRGPEGILNCYLRSRLGKVGTFFDHVLQHPCEDLGTLFRLPDLASIQPKVKPEVFAILSGHYANAPKHITQVATVYRTPPAATHIQDLATLPHDWNERVFIMLEAPGTPATVSTKGAAPQVFNKIKHRFMLIESVDEYAKLPDAAQYRAVVIEYTWAKVQPLIEALRTVSMGMAEIAATIRVLDEAGVAI